MISLNEYFAGAPLYQLKIVLRSSRPVIWRRVLVRADMRLDRLHNVIQRVMPWTNTHLHRFSAGGMHFGPHDPELPEIGEGVLNEKHHTLVELAPAAKMKFIYEYDFGDSWFHEVMVEKVLPPDAGFKHPACLAGANACPPDDCGGMHGYYQMLKALADPMHRKHHRMKEWIGGGWDPAWFEVDIANDLLKRLKA